MRYSLTAEEALANLIEIIENRLNDIIDTEFKNEFIVGEWYAYIECLEAVSCWKDAKKSGLFYDPEKRYKII